jgi:hypothetical protein
MGWPSIAGEFSAAHGGCQAGAAAVALVADLARAIQSGSLCVASFAAIAARDAIAVLAVKVKPPSAVAPRRANALYSP